MTARERLGADYKPPPVPTRYIKQADDDVLAEGEAALKRIRGSRPMDDWVKIGAALLVLRKRAMVDVGAPKPRGLHYVVRNSALVRQHGFTVISKSARQTAMLVVENLPAIEEWLKTLDDERRTSLHHPMCLWRQWLAHKRYDKNRTSEGAWRDRRTMPKADFDRLLASITETSPSGDPLHIAMSACRALGYSVPRSVLRDKPRYEYHSFPTTPWSPFALSL
jgi:hypothetical protein